MKPVPTNFLLAMTTSNGKQHFTATASPKTTMDTMSLGRRLCLLSLVTAYTLVPAEAWGSSSSSSTSGTAKFYANERSNWMFGANNIAMKVEGCVWATTDDNEDLGCMNDASGDGTTYWYQMAMCRRAQVAYSVYATTSGSSSCSSGNFKGTVSSRFVVIYLPLSLRQL